MKRTNLSKYRLYVICSVLLSVPFYYLSKLLFKFDNVLTTIAVISTSVTFMLTPVSNIPTNIAPNVGEVLQSNNNYNYNNSDNHHDSNSEEYFDFENINDKNEFLSNNINIGNTTNADGIEEALQPVVPTLIKPANAGDIIRKTYEAGATTNFIGLDSGFINNNTEISNATVMETIAQSPNIDIIGDGTIEVLIMHTHATETYLEVGQTEWYDLAYDGRTTDETKNVIRVGQEIAKQLEEAGIGVIHDTTLHDYPSFNGAYDRSAVTVKEILEANPEIKVVLDVHRDAIVNNSTTITSPVTTINGKDAAQIMIISGCDNGLYNMPNYMENLKFSAALQSKMEFMYPTLTRPVLFDYRKYNQDLTTGSILLEMGGHGNTLDEAIYSGELIGNALVEVLTDLKK